MGDADADADGIGINVNINVNARPTCSRDTDIYLAAIPYHITS